MDIIPNEVLRDILSRCGEYTSILKEVCYEWNEILSNTNVDKAALSFEKMAERGHIDLIEYIGKDRINADTTSCILRHAARGGHLNIMILAKEWGATEYDEALEYAATSGQTLAMHLAKEWEDIRFNQSLATTEAEHIDFAHSWKIRTIIRYIRPVALAAENGQLLSMHLLKEWGATDYDWYLANAAEGGQIPAMYLAKEWGATNYNRALANAAMSGQIPAMHLAKKWGANDYDWALAGAAEFGQIPAMHLLREWGADDYDKALFCGSHRIEIVELLTSWMNYESDDE